MIRYMLHQCIYQMSSLWEVGGPGFTESVEGEMLHHGDSMTRLGRDVVGVVQEDVVNGVDVVDVVGGTLPRGDFMKR